MLALPDAFGAWDEGSDHAKEKLVIEEEVSDGDPFEAEDVEDEPDHCEYPETDLCQDLGL